MKIDTGVSFIKVALTELSFKLNKNFKPPKGGIPVDISFKTKSSFSPDKRTLNVTLFVSLFQKSRVQPFIMKVSVEGTFLSNNYEELKRFSKVNAIAHLFPFIREIIGNATMKANIPPLLLPPFNLNAMLGVEKS